jgi:hypothetical protein
MRSAVISDLHLGGAGGGDLLRHEAMQDRLAEALADADRLVLLGDVLELRDHPIRLTMERARPFFERIGEAMAGREVVLVPGNHDHKLLGHWLDRDSAGRGENSLAEGVPTPHPCIEAIRDWLGKAELRMSYPGLWLREDVYATHGHYLDSHVTLPTIERLSIAAVDRMRGRPTGVRHRPDDYERVHAPVYDLLFNLAQGARPPRDATDEPPTMRIWKLAAGAGGRARNWRGRLLANAVIPVTLLGLERAGLGRFGRDLSLAEVGRAGVAGMRAVVRSLGIEAEHVIFGHIHRRGPLPGEDGRSASDPEWERRGAPTLHNTGSWVHVPAMVARGGSAGGFWPGRVLFVGPEGPPEPVEVLAELDAAGLAGSAPPRERSPG